MTNMVKLFQKQTGRRPWDRRGRTEDSTPIVEPVVEAGAPFSMGGTACRSPGEPKKPREIRRHTDLEILERTTTSVTHKRLPPRTGKNLKHCHFLKGGREIARLGKHPWEERVAGNLRTLEANRFARHNAIYHALAHISGLLGEAETRESVLHATSEELKRTSEVRERYARELARANEDLEQFASVASHDLQEPLKKVIRHARRILKSSGADLDPETEKDLETVMDETVHMQALIKAVLAYARVETVGEIEETADCDSILDQALSNLSASLEESSARIVRDPLPTLKGDFEQLIRLFQNLVGNALKYYDPEKADPFVHVSAKRMEEASVPMPDSAGNAGWLFRVKDNGVGIDEDFQDDIFNMFIRLYTRDEIPGEGMGLAICKRIVKRHRGEIWVESEYGVGSRFYFTIPDQ